MSRQLVNLSSFVAMSGKGKRWNESQRSEIIAKLSKPTASSKRSLVRDYEVGEPIIRKIWKNREKIQKRSALMSEEAKTKTF